MKPTVPDSVLEFIEKNKTCKPYTFNRELTSVDDILNKSYTEEGPFNSGLHCLPLVLPFELPYKDMLKEAEALTSCFVPHRDGGYEDHWGWKSLCIRGLSSCHTASHDSYGFKNADGTSMKDVDVPYIWTDICKWAPKTYQFFRDTFAYKWMARVRFMLLEPGGYISPHRDTERHYMGPVNIALNNPNGCDFIMKDRGVVPFNDGTANKLCIGYEHIVYNNSDEPRFHIIVHGAPKSDPWNFIFLNSYMKFKQEFK